MKICMLSDVHEQWHNLVVPECDLLVSAGDYSYLGRQHIVDSFHYWLSMQKAKHIISVQGNHEVWVEMNFQEARDRVHKIDKRILFVADQEAIVEGKRIWCSSITPAFHNWAWNVPRGKKIRAYWDQIPDDIDMLVTHGPPYGILDQQIPHPQPSNVPSNTAKYDHLGCEELIKKVRQFKNLKLHVFGHIHGSSGVYVDQACRYNSKPIVFINAAICNEQYTPANPVRECTIYDKE